MDLSAINDMIDELENKEMSLSNVRNLSALYNVKNHLLCVSTYNNTSKELSDILPSYLHYIDTKRKYQLQEISNEAVYAATKSLCKEIKEFIQSVYSSTDTPKEREIIQQMILEMR